MAKEIIKMSKKEVDRLRILHRVMDKQLTQVYGAKLLGISDRQVRNLLDKIYQSGDKVHIPVKLATDSGVIRPPIGAKRRWCIIIPPSDRNGSRQTSFFSWILP